MQTNCRRLAALAEWTGLEPATPGVTGRYSNQLNYHSTQVPWPSRRRFEQLAEWTGLEPATPGVTGRYSNQLNYHSVLSNRLAFQPRWRIISISSLFVKSLCSKNLKKVEKLVDAESLELPTYAL